MEDNTTLISKLSKTLLGFGGSEEETITNYLDLAGLNGTLKVVNHHKLIDIYKLFNDDDNTTFLKEFEDLLFKCNSYVEKVKNENIKQ